ncbi:hypothetical protein BTVI_43768 [Pitangus sulphuratus]|nr:hypothetical protein BTVI_43768 [Pitangus sulphuratus]
MYRQELSSLQSVYVAKRTLDAVAKVSAYKEDVPEIKWGADRDSEWFLCAKDACDRPLKGVCRYLLDFIQALEQGQAAAAKTQSYRGGGEGELLEKYLAETVVKKTVGVKPTLDLPTSGRIININV